jgi:spore maturation protein CgeB
MYPYLLTECLCLNIKKVRSDYMKKYKILFITKDFSNNIERNTVYFSEELAKFSDLTLWYEPGNINDILDKLNLQPDFILLNDMMPTRCPEITDLSTVPYPFGIIMHDIHKKVEERKKYIIQNNVKVIFSIYRDAFYKDYSEFKEYMHWLPHYVNTDIFKDYGLLKRIDILMMGAVSNAYPLRKVMRNYFKGRKGFVYRPHPGYTNLGQNSIYGKDFAKEINRSKIFLTDDTKYHYPVIKYYEVLAGKALLLAPTSEELEDLGFIPGVHFVDINEENFAAKAEYYLEHEDERLKIVEEGYKMVHAHHSTLQRVMQFLQIVESILE